MAPTFKGLSPEVHAKLTKSPDTLKLGGPFAEGIASRLELVEVDVTRREKDGKMQAKVTYTITVSGDMLNIAGTMHGGCAVYLIDMCSSIVLVVLAHAVGQRPHLVSQALNTTFHAPAPLGAKLEIVNKTIAFGARTVSAITEIWDVTNGRLCTTGVHTKMAPSLPKL